MVPVVKLATAVSVLLQVSYVFGEPLHLIQGNWMDPGLQALEFAEKSDVRSEKLSAMSLIEHHVHFEFSKNVEDLLWVETRHGLTYAGTRYTHERFDLDAKHIKEYTLFQMIFALSSQDPLYSLCTMELVQKLGQVETDGLKYWLVENFNVTNELAYGAVQYFCKLVALKNSAEFKVIVGLIHYIVDEFFVLDTILFDSDSETLAWLVASGYKISGNFINEAWKQQKNNLIQAIISNNGSSSTGFYEAMTTLSWNNTFVDFIVQTQNDYVILDVFESSEIPYESFIRGCLRYNKWSIIKNLEIIDPLKWKNLCDSSLFSDIIAQNKLDALQYMLSLGFEINLPDNEGASLLLRALEMNNTLMTGAILYNGGEVNHLASCNCTPLHTAVVLGMFDATVKLIPLGASIDARDCFGLSPLHTAILKGNQTFINFLCRKYEENNSTLINEIVHFAAKNGSQETIETIINTGISINLNNKDDMTPLDVAISSCQSRNAFVLIKHGATFNKSKGCYGYLRSAIKCNDSRLLSYILGKEIDETEIKENGESLLTLAVHNKNVKITRLLLEKGVGGNSSMSSPVVEAVRNNDIEILEILSSYNLSLESGGKVLLHEAARHNSLAAIEWLISQGRAVDEQTKEGSTALAVAAGSGCLSAVRSLLAHGAAVDSANADGLTPLHQAARAGHLFVVRELLGRGADPRAKDLLQGWSPVHWAASAGHQSVLMELADRGADLDSRDRSGNAPLHIATVHSHYPVLLELAERGADLNARNLLNQTALFIAENLRHANIAKSLKFRGATL